MEYSSNNTNNMLFQHQLLQLIANTTQSPTTIANVSVYQDELITSTISISSTTTSVPSTTSTTTDTSSSYPIIPIRDSLSIVIPMTIIYSTILLTGLLGNLITCIVIYKISYMHTSTNYYLFSLAISDLLLLLCGLPQEIYLIWFRYPYVFGEVFCILRGITAETSANATVLTITAFTVERYVAVCHPLKTHKLSKLSRVIKAIVVIWILSFALAIPQAVQFGVVDETSPNGDVILIKDAWCSIKRGIQYSFEISILVVFLIPMILITILYIFIGLKLRRPHRSATINGSNAEFSTNARFPSYRSQTHVIRMLVAVVVAFFISYAPFHAQRLLAIYAHGTKSQSIVAIYDFITHVSGILYFLSTCVNPMLYHIFSNKFRQAFKDTISHLFGPPRSTAYGGRGAGGSLNRRGELGIISFKARPASATRTCKTCHHPITLCSCVQAPSGGNHSGAHGSQASGERKSGTGSCHNNSVGVGVRGGERERESGHSCGSGGRLPCRITN